MPLHQLRPAQRVCSKSIVLNSTFIYNNWCEGTTPHPALLPMGMALRSGTVPVTTQDLYTMNACRAETYFTLYV